MIVKNYHISNRHNMRKFCFVIIQWFAITLFSGIAVFAQRKPINIHHIKDETVIRSIDSIPSIKILYSFDDRYYLILLNTTPRKEYFAVLDSLGQITYSKLINCADFFKSRENQQLNAMLKEAGPIYSLKRYNNLVNYNCEHIISSFGTMSHFAVLCPDGNIYAEYTLPAITTPLPIDQNLLMYLFRRLCNEIHDYSEISND